MKNAIDLDIKVLIAYHDSEIIVRQVRNSINCLSKHLQSYQREVWNLISHFDAFNIISVPRSQNQEADLLANVASKLIPSENLTPDFFSVELIFRPSIPDNIFNWRVFDNDVQVLNFLMNEDTFKYSAIDEVTHEENMQDFSVINDFCSVENAFEKVKPVPNSVLRLEISLICRISLALFSIVKKTALERDMKPSI